MAVYFIRDSTYAVKIGRTEDVLQRINALRANTSLEIEIIRVIEGDRETEKWFHRYFKDQWIRGEWFKFTPEMLTIKPPPHPLIKIEVATNDDHSRYRYRRRLHHLVESLTESEVAEFLSLAATHFKVRHKYLTEPLDCSNIKGP